MRRSILLPALALLAAACRPDAPATEANHPAAAPSATPVAAAPAPGAATGPPAPAGNPTDTLHLPGGQVGRLQPSTAAAFNRLPADTVPDLYSTDPEPIDLTQLRGAAGASTCGCNPRRGRW
ncbi:MAG: hypothetical protein ACRYFX_22230 [Janthinobacterium lividum]